ncbi:hypothetical protein LCGC14_1332960 [marine sediment metagenome]|uniref:Uncharacterized protein n=1 Tax=marine sediment metagenome TaxID=412755 RepID=A0A0F9L212_9ZZZZ
MTCIVGFIDKRNNVYIGGDSAGVDSNYSITDREDSKVFRNGQMIMGYTSSFRMGQILRFKLKIPKHPKDISDYEYMCTLFIDAVRECLKSNGYSTINNNEELIGVFIVGYKTKLYNIHQSLQVGISRDKYIACGCGREYALGSLATNQIQDPIKLITKALIIAEKFSAGVRRPFNIIKL